MKKSDVDNAVIAAHARISEYLAGAASPRGEVLARKVSDVVDRAFGELHETLDAAAGLPPRR